MGQLTEASVERRGLATAGRASYQQYAATAVQRLVEQVGDVIGKAEVVDVRETITGAEQSDDRFFSEQCRERADTHVQGAVG